MPKEQVREFRPIALLSYLGKVLELLITWQLRPLSQVLPCQFGCRRGYAASDAVALALYWSGRASPSNIPFAAVFLHMSKAFDRLRHSVLLQLLYELGISRQLWNLLHSWKTGSSARVRFRGSGSQKFSLKHRIPQSSPLSVLLWQIFVSESPLEGGDIAFMDDFMNRLSQLNSRSSLTESCSRHTLVVSNSMQRSSRSYPTQSTHTS